VFCDTSEIGFGGHLTTGSEDEPVEIYGIVGLVKNKLRAPLGESLRQLTGF
jgi:hypothetical protein